MTFNYFMLCFVIQRSLEEVMSVSNFCVASELCASSITFLTQTRQSFIFTYIYIFFFFNVDLNACRIDFDFEDLCLNKTILTLTRK